MKSTFHGLSDLAKLQKELNKQSKLREQQAAKQREVDRMRTREQNEFKTAVGKVAPIKDKGRFIHPPRVIELPVVTPLNQNTAQPARKDPLSDGFDGQHLRDDESGAYLRQGTPESLLKKLIQGQWPISMRLDLHGNTQEEARIATHGFLYRATREQARVVSIIHGQGFSSSSGEPVLKKQVRNWLVQNPNVLAFCPAPAQAGGHGAVLVLMHLPK